MVFFAGILKAHKAHGPWTRGSGSTPKCHGSRTLSNWIIIRILFLGPWRCICTSHVTPPTRSWCTVWFVIVNTSHQLLYTLTSSSNMKKLRKANLAPLSNVLFQVLLAVWKPLKFWRKILALMICSNNRYRKTFWTSHYENFVFCW